jgi:hypothetical protein
MTEPEVPDTHSSSNQRATEPIPPTQAHDVPDSAPGGDDRADAGAGTSTGPGPREGTPAGGVALSGSFASSSPAGHEVSETRPEPSGADDVAQGPHDPGRVESDLPGHASRVPGVVGDSPEPFGVDNAAGAARMDSGGAAESLGETHEVPANTFAPAEGTSETAQPVDGVRITSIAREGLADGEPENASPPTSTF